MNVPVAYGTGLILAAIAYGYGSVSVEVIVGLGAFFLFFGIMMWVGEQ